MSDTVVVTGAAGRVGRQVMRELVNAGHRPRGIDRQQDTDHAVDVVADLSDTWALREALAGAEIVVHLAAFMSWREDDAADVFQANVAGTFNLLEAVRVTGVPQIILASSGEVYPEMAPRYLPITEEHPTEPRSHYGMSKLLCEQMAWFYARRYGVATTVLRFPHTQDASELLDPDSTFCGPRFFLRRKLAQQRALGNEEAVSVLAAYDDGRERLVLSRSQDGQPYCMPICDTRDTTAGIVLAVETPGARGQTIALGPPEEFRFNLVVPQMSELTGLDYIDVCLPGKGTHYTVDISKARHLLGYNPRYGVKRMLTEAVAAYHDRASTHPSLSTS